MREVSCINNFDEMASLRLDERPSGFVVHRTFGKVQLMQYTGLKDKNGKEIYEGDICKYDNGITNSIPYIFTVHWDSVKARFCEANEGNKTDGSFLYSDKTEVIGNIYEHPELLK